MVKRILNHRSKTIFSAAFVLGIAALVSRVLGLIRDRLLAGRFGAGDELDIYFTAFRLPDFVYSVLILGAIASAFIPVFSEYFEKDKKEAWKLTSGLFNLASIFLIIISAIFVVLAPLLISLIAPGFSGAKRDITIILTRIMFLSPILFGLSSIFGGVLQYFHKFFVNSLAPVLYNIGIIIGIIFLVPKLGLIGLAWGVVLGAGLHLLIQMPVAIASGFRFQGGFNFFHKGIKKIIKLMIPRTIGLAGFQINFLIITAIASTLVSGSIAIFNLSHNLYYVPIGIVGISFASAVFPRLSKSFIQKDRKEFSFSFSVAFNEILYLVLPISVLFFLLRAQIVRIVLGTGEFSWVDTRLTAASLGIFSVCVFAQALVPLISRSFYAFHNTRTPVLISLWSILINIAGSFFFVWILVSGWFSEFISGILRLNGISDFTVLGLPMAFALAGILNFVFLLRAFDKKIGYWKPKLILESVWKMIISCVLMAIIVFSFLYLLDSIFDTKTFLGILFQTCVAGFFGGLVYFISTLILRSPEAKGLVKRILRK